MRYLDNDGLLKKEKALDVWRSIYCWVIPTFSCSIYAVIYILTKREVINWYTLFESANVNGSLEAIITFISIVLSFFGVLLPILISSKETSELIKWYFDVIDKKYFIESIKKVFLSGLTTILLSCFMFFNDIFIELFIFVISLILIWTLIYFIASSYRFIGILLSLLIIKKDTGYKKEQK